MRTTLVIDWILVFNAGAWLCLFAAIVSSWKGSSEAERKLRALREVNKD